MHPSNERTTPPDVRSRKPATFPLVLLLLSMTTANGAAQTFRVLHHFASGSSPQGNLAVGDGAIYGTTMRSGASDRGTVYRVNADGSAFTILKEFAGSDGLGPQAGLVRSGTTLYGTTTGGGAFQSGTVFKIHVDGSGFEVLRDFGREAGDGTSPAGSEGLLLAGTTLYGMTKGSGVSNNASLGWGTVFKMQTDGTGFTVLHNFAGGDESYPWAGLASDGATLFGTTSGWATANRGTVFRIGTDGSGYACLWRYTGGAEAAFPLGGVVLCGSTLFGTTYYGPGSKYPGGTVFRLKSDGTGYTLLNTNVLCPRGGIVLLDGVLYGTTIYGGTGNRGSVYALTTNGAVFRILKGFTGSDGSTPWGGLILSDRTLYGTTLAGGAFEGGTLYMLSVPVPSIVSGPVSQTVDAGTTVQFSVDAAGMYPLNYEWRFNQAELPGAGTGASLVLTNVQKTQIGAYSVIVTNVFGSATSTPALLNVIEAPPTIAGNPVGRTVELGTEVAFCARVTGSPPLQSQWYFNDSNIISGASNSLLRLDNPQFSSSGGYTLVVTNLFGAATSAPVMLNVIAPVERRPVPCIQCLGEVGSYLNLEYSDTLSQTQNWCSLDAVVLVSSPELYFDVSIPLSTQRYYRVWQTGAASVLPALTLQGMVPAIILNESIGTSVRVDAIKQVGPTDAWFTLGTVTMTNTPQLYFDVAAPGQPPRLYRLVPVP